MKVPVLEGPPGQKPKGMSPNRAYDSDPLSERLTNRGIDVIVPTLTAASIALRR